MKGTFDLLQPVACNNPPVFFIQFDQRTRYPGQPNGPGGPKLDDFKRRCSMKKLSIALAAVLTGCAPMAEMIQNPGQPTVKTVSTTEQGLNEADLESYNGPKARVAVYRFGDRTGKGKGIVVQGYPGYSWYPARTAGWPSKLARGSWPSAPCSSWASGQALKDVE